jgi:hypothetical protein
MLRSVRVYLVDDWLAFFSDSLGSNPIRRSKFVRLPVDEWDSTNALASAAGGNKEAFINGSCSAAGT